jgi:hypothetical protein
MTDSLVNKRRAETTQAVERMAVEWRGILRREGDIEIVRSCIRAFSDVAQDARRALARLEAEALGVPWWHVFVRHTCSCRCCHVATIMLIDKPPSMDAAKACANARQENGCDCECAFCVWSRLPDGERA